jgi:hypothetical protein
MAGSFERDGDVTSIFGVGVECQRTAMHRLSLFSRILLLLVVLVVALPLFWFAGGIRWLDTTVFPPRRPKDMPQNAIWIDAPALPISWHRGWWFGCDTSSTGMANYCRLAMANGSDVYAGEYLPCEDKSPLPPSKINLVPPPDQVGMWIADKRLKELAPIGALRKGDLLVPAAVLDRCDELKGKHRSN